MRSNVSSTSDAGLSHAVGRPLGGGLKRVFDVSFAVAALLASSLLLLGLMAAIRMRDGGPVFYLHERVGYDGGTFGCLKLRTMYVDADHRLKEHLEACPEARDEFRRTRKLRNDPRIIPKLGHFLRKSSLDELPQFVNVLRGDMSVVGPRPVTRDELHAYGGNACEYLATRPGITGLWQVSGRNDLDFPDRVRLDAQYVQNWRFVSDLGIIARTIGTLLSMRGAY